MIAASSANVPSTAANEASTGPVDGNAPARGWLSIVTPATPTVMVSPADTTGPLEVMVVTSPPYVIAIRSPETSISAPADFARAVSTTTCPSATVVPGGRGSNMAVSYARTVTVRDTVPVCPWSSVTPSATRWIPGVANRCDAPTPAAAPPSPNSQAYAAIAPSGSTEASPVNETVSAVVGAGGENANAAAGRPSTLIATVAGAPVSGPEATV